MQTGWRATGIVENLLLSSWAAGYRRRFYGAPDRAMLCKQIDEAIICAT